MTAAYVTPKDRVLEYSTSNSQTVFALAGAPDTSFNAFSASMSVGDWTIGCVVEPGVAFKSGKLTYSATNEITVDSTGYETKGTFSSGGTKEIMMGMPAAAFRNLPDGTRVVTQSAGDNSTKPASTEYVDRLIVGRNRLINGAMAIDQYNAGGSIAQSNTPTYPVDRFYILGSTGSKFTAQRSTDAPVGFVNSLLMTSSSSFGIGGSDYYLLRQAVEGLNCRDLAWGTVNAKTLVLGFLAKSSLTGTFGGSITNNGSDRWYPFTYTISAANTWEFKTVVIPGDQTGTWLTTNGAGIIVTWSLGTGTSVSGTVGAWSSSAYISATGAVSLVGTSGATLQIAGTQLEQGTSATLFEFRHISQELSLCQRYFEKSWDADVALNTNTIAGALAWQYPAASTIYYGPNLSFKVPKRAAPTITFYNWNDGTAQAVNVGTGSNTTGLLPYSTIGKNGCMLTYTSPAGAVSTLSCHYKANAEL